MIEEFLREAVGWAQRRADIRALALVGSHARGTPHEDSDIDLVVLTTSPAVYTENPNWARGFGKIANHQIEQWGCVTSVRVWYESGLEVEFGFSTPDWAVAPLDEGTRRVVADGIRVLLDRDSALAALAEAHIG